MILATCLANAYKDDRNVAIDVGSSASALRDWTYYDLEQSPDKVLNIISIYLTQDYSNLLVETEIKGVRFDFLKVCFD